MVVPMKISASFAVLALLAVAGSAPAGEEMVPHRVLVELFTSQG
jgi:hypothetical protein